MPDTVLTAAIHTVISQPTVALMRNEMGIGAAVLSGTNTGDSGTVTLVSVANANGFSGTVANDTTTPIITIVPGNITPTGVASTGAISGTTLTATGVVTVPAGSAAAPAIISTTGTSDTGPFYEADVYGIATAGVERLRVDASGNVGIGATSPGAKLDVNSDSMILRTEKTPASASATGTKGTICWDASYVYVCVATDTWKRSAIATW